MKTDFDAFLPFVKRTGKEVKFVDCENVVTYSRVSSKEQHDKNLSLETQDRAFNEHASKTNKNIVARFGGTYESAKTDGRKEFQRMLTYIKNNKGRVSQIWVYMTDRFSRTGAAAMLLAEQLRQKYGVTVYALCQPTDTRDESGAFNQNLQFLFSHYDNRLRRKRMMDGMKGKFEKGIWVVRLPQGYTSIKEKGERKIVITEEGHKIKKAFMWKVKGMKNEEIIKRLRALGVHMYKQQLTKIFKNPFYCGMLCHNMLDGKVVEGTHEKLISHEVFLKVNDIHRKSPNYGVPHKKEIEDLPLKVFVRCAKCNEPYTGYFAKKKRPTGKIDLIYYYKCRTTGCKCNKNAFDLHKTFLNELSNVIVKPELISSVQYELESYYHDITKDSVEQERNLKARLTDISKKIETIEEKYYVENEMSKEIFEKFKTKYVTERLEIQEQIRNCAVNISTVHEWTQKAVTFSSKLNTVWTSGGIQVKENLQKLVFPNGIAYNRENDTFRPAEKNFIFSLIEANSGSSEENKKRTNELVARLSLSAEREGCEPTLPLIVSQLIESCKMGYSMDDAGNF